MKLFSQLIALIVLNFTSITLFAQDSLIAQITRKNMGRFSVEGKMFKGDGWDSLVKRIENSDYVLLGEDHFTNEIPFFTSAIISRFKFDNFFCEIDPYSTKIIESKIKNLTELPLKKFVADFRNVFSFYAFESEFELLRQLITANTSIYGTDQILVAADRLICNELKQVTGNEKAKKIYENIEQQSTTYFADFLKDQSKPFYMFTGEFEKDIAALLELNLSEKEKEVIEALQLSAGIYKKQNHHLRIQLMKNNLMDVYTSWENKKNLFKFGANHLPKGESLMEIYDIGNLVNNVADSKFKSSLHIMIAGKSGSQASPFKGFPEQAVDENGDNLKSLKPLFNNVTTGQWHCFDMLPLRRELESRKVLVNDIQLLRIIKGYDYVIIIPKVSAAKFANTE